MDIIEKFKKSKFFVKADKYVDKPDKLKSLLAVTAVYSAKKGLSGVRSDLELLAGFLKDTIQGKYKIRNKTNILLAVAALLYVVSPMDFVPDFFIALGLLDDIAIVCWAMNRLNKELIDYKKSKIDEDKSKE